MGGLKKIADQAKFRRKCEKAAEKADSDAVGFSVDVDFDSDSRSDDAYEDDGCLHVRRFGLRAMFSIGQDTPGVKANAATRTIMAAVGMKRKIGKRVLVQEECEACEGEGEVTGSCGHDHSCDDCCGLGFTLPEDY